MKKIYFLFISLLFVIQVIAPDQLYAQCPAPSTLTVSGVTQNSVVITWQTSNVSGFYNVRYQSANNPNWITLNNVSSPLTITGLNCGGVYVGQVQQVCPQTGTSTPLYSDWTNITFTTLACQNTCSTPTGLVASNMSQTGVVLSSTSATTNSFYNIRYRNGGSATWTTLTNVTLPYQLGNLSCGTGFEWQVQRVCTTSPGTNTLLSDWSTSATFSTLACTNQCTTPTGSSTTNIGQTSAVLSWNPNIIAVPSIYNIRYHTANSSTWIVVNNVALPYQLGNLTCGTGYIWQVQQVCSSATEPSPWSTGTTFSTIGCTNVCEAPSGLTATNINQTTAVLNWNPNSTTTSLYNLQYHSASSSTWITINNVTMPYTLSNLVCGTGYAWQVQRVCTTNPAGTTPALSPWTTSTFSTPACTVVCEAPTGLTSTNITQTGAVLNWNQNSPASSLYNLQYHSANSTTWITISNVTMPYQLGNLTCGTGYAWRVQRVCSNASGTTPTLSDWSTATFSTSACPSVCEAPSALTTTNITQTSAVLNWNPNNTAASLYNLQYRSVASTAWITVNNVSMPYTLGNLNCGSGYVWRIQRVCSSTTDPSPWSISFTFATLTCSNPCAAPVGLNVSNVSQTGVVFGLIPVTSNNNFYNIRYHTGNSTVWIVINNVTLPYQLGNLPCGTGFEWQIQQVCGPSSGTLSGVSPWSVGATFSTLGCPNPCVAPTQLSVSAITQTSAVISWAIPNTLTQYNVQYRADGNPNWTVLNNVSSPLTLTGLNCGAVYIFQVQQVCSNSAGAVTVSPWSSVTFTTPPCQNPCVAPTELNTTNISQTGAVLNCGPAATGSVFNIRYRTATSATWVTLTNVTMPYQLGNLPCGTGFEWQVQRVCNTTTTPTNALLSPWSASTTFSTLGCSNPCATPTGLIATNSSQTGVVLNCGPTTVTGNVYNIRYRSANSTVWTTLTNVSMPYQLGNLSCGTGFQWQVQRICGTNSGTLSALSPWSVSATFSTLACTNPNPCVIPTGLSTTNINQNSAVLNWVTTAANGLFNIRYRSSNSTNWIVVNNVTAPYQLGNLSCSSGYVWQVQRICITPSGTTTELSQWSTPKTFSTSPCIIPCAAPMQLSANDITQTSAILNWGAVSGAVAYIVNYRLANNTSTVVTTITTTTNSIVVNGLIPGASYIYQVRALCAIGTVGTTMSPFSAGYLFSTPSALVIYPNPANEILRMSILVNQPSTVTIQLRDSFGQLVVAVNELAAEGSNEFKINTVGMSEGIYFLTINTISDSITSKVFIKH